VGSGAPGKTRVEVNLSDSTDQVALGYLKKYGRKLAVEWPIQGLKYGALAALAVGGAGYMAASAAVQKARSLFGGRELASYDPAAAAAKKQEGGFFSRMIRNHIQETLAHEMSRTMSLMIAINQEARLRQEMGGDMMVDMEKALERGDYLNLKEAAKHPRFEMSTVRTWEYDEHWIVSATGRRARVCVQGYLDQKEEVERESNEKLERRRRAKERKKQGLPPEEPPTEQSQAEKTFDWHFVHVSVFFDDDSRQLILTHDDEAGKDLLLLPDAEWPGDEPSRTSAGIEEAWEVDEDEGHPLPQRRAHAPSQFIDAEVIQPQAPKSKSKTKKR
jgi:hypothetical protein